jgi:hypothetical protein
MLKYEHIQAGQTIKAYDHPPFPERRPMFFEGVVEGTMEDRGGVMFLKVRCTKDATFLGDHNRVGLIVNVPMEIFDEDVDYSEMSGEDRVQVLA